MCSVTTLELWTSLQCLRVDPKIYQRDLAYAKTMAIVHVGVREERIAEGVGATGVFAVAVQLQEYTHLGTPRRAIGICSQLDPLQKDVDASRPGDAPSLAFFRVTFRGVANCI